jgi:hypothetical protein
MTIGGYFVNGYWWLLLAIILMGINGYFISGYWCILVVIIYLYNILGWSSFPSIRPIIRPVNHPSKLSKCLCVRQSLLASPVGGEELGPLRTTTATGAGRFSK